MRLHLNEIDTSMSFPISRLRVTELRDLAKQLGLSCNGLKKNELVSLIEKFNNTKQPKQKTLDSYFKKKVSIEDIEFEELHFSIKQKVIPVAVELGVIGERLAPLVRTKLVGPRLQPCSHIKAIPLAVGDEERIEIEQTCEAIPYEIDAEYSSCAIPLAVGGGVVGERCSLHDYVEEDDPDDDGLPLPQDWIFFAQHHEDDKCNKPWTLANPDPKRNWDNSINRYINLIKTLIYY